MFALFAFCTALAALSQAAPIPSISFSSPTAFSSYRQDDNVTVSWSTTSRAAAVEFPTLQLCIDDPLMPESLACGATNWTTPDYQDGVYTVTMPVPDVLRAAHYIFWLRDRGIGGGWKSPTFDISPSPATSATPASAVASSAAAAKSAHGIHAATVCLAIFLSLFGLAVLAAIGMWCIERRNRNRASAELAEATIVPYTYTPDEKGGFEPMPAYPAHALVRQASSLSHKSSYLSDSAPLATAQSKDSDLPPYSQPPPSSPASTPNEHHADDGQERGVASARRMEATSPRAWYAWVERTAGC